MSSKRGWAGDYLPRFVVALTAVATAEVKIMAFVGAVGAARRSGRRRGDRRTAGARRTSTAYDRLRVASRIDDARVARIPTVPEVPLQAALLVAVATVVASVLIALLPPRRTSAARPGVLLRVE